MSEWGIKSCNECGSVYRTEGEYIIPSRPALQPIDKAVLVDNILSAMGVENRPGIQEIHQWILDNTYTPAPSGRTYDEV